MVGPATYMRGWCYNGLASWRNGVLTSLAGYRVSTGTVVRFLFGENGGYDCEEDSVTTPLGLCPVCPFVIPLDHGRIADHNDCPGRGQIPIPDDDWRRVECHDDWHGISINGQ